MTVLKWGVLHTVDSKVKGKTKQVLLMHPGRNPEPMVFVTRKDAKNYGMNLEGYKVVRVKVTVTVVKK